MGFWYEECPIINETEEFIYVESKFDIGSISNLLGTYEIKLDKKPLLRDGYCYHLSEYEYFYVESKNIFRNVISKHPSEI